MFDIYLGYSKLLNPRLLAFWVLFSFFFLFSLKYSKINCFVFVIFHLASEEFYRACLDQT